MRERAQRTVNFLRSVETCTQGLEFLSEEQLDRIPPGVASHIIELEDLLSRLSCEATAELFHLGHLPFVSRGQK